VNADSERSIIAAGGTWLSWEEGLPVPSVVVNGADAVLRSLLAEGGLLAELRSVLDDFDAYASTDWDYATARFRPNRVLPVLARIDDLRSDLEAQ
jgi:hypothetical protein